MKLRIDRAPVVVVVVITLFVVVVVVAVVVVVITLFIVVVAVVVVVITLFVVVVVAVVVVAAVVVAVVVITLFVVVVVVAAAAAVAVADYLYPRRWSLLAHGRTSPSPTSSSDAISTLTSVYVTPLAVTSPVRHLTCTRYTRTTPSICTFPTTR